MPLQAPRRIEVRVPVEGEVRSEVGNAFASPGRSTQLAVPPTGPFTVHWLTADRVWTFVDIEVTALDLTSLVAPVPRALGSPLRIEWSARVDEAVSVVVVAAGTRVSLDRDALGATAWTGGAPVTALAAWHRAGALVGYSVASVPSGTSSITLVPTAPEQRLTLGVDGSPTVGFEVRALAEGVDTGLVWAQGKLKQGQALQLALPGAGDAPNHDAWLVEVNERALGVTPPRRTWWATLPFDRTSHVFEANPLPEVTPALASPIAVGSVPLPLSPMRPGVDVTAPLLGWIQLDLEPVDGCEGAPWTVLAPESTTRLRWSAPSLNDPLSARRVLGRAARVDAGQALDDFLTAGRGLTWAAGEASLQGAVGLWRGPVEACAGAATPGLWRVQAADRSGCNALSQTALVSRDACGRLSLELENAGIARGALAEALACGRLTDEAFESRSGARFAVTPEPGGALTIAYPGGDLRATPWAGPDRGSSQAAPRAAVGDWTTLVVQSDFVPSGAVEAAPALRIVHARDDGRGGGGVRVDAQGGVSLVTPRLSRSGALSEALDAPSAGIDARGVLAWAPKECGVGGALDVRDGTLTLTWDEASDEPAGRGTRRYRVTATR